MKMSGRFGFTLIFLVFSLIFLAACSQANAVTINVPTTQQTEIIITETADEPVATDESTTVLTEEPTAVPTEVPTQEPTAIPTEEPTATPTLEPTPVPTEVPMYIGLAAGEAEALRRECLVKNPDSLCLPLPAEPDGPVTEKLYDNSEEEAAFGMDLPDVYSLEFQLLAGQLVAPLSGNFRAYGSLDGYRRFLDPSRATAGMSGTFFVDYGPYTANPYGSPDDEEPGWPMGNITFQFSTGSEVLEDGELQFLASSGRGNVQSGQLLLRTGAPVLVQLNARPQVVVVSSPEFGELRGVTSSIFLTDLLRTPEGSVVYVLPN